MSLILSAAGAALLALLQPACAAENLESLKRELARLGERVAAIETKAGRRQGATPAATVEVGDKPRSWKLPGTNTSMFIGGYAKLDVIWDLGPSLAAGNLDDASVYNAPAGGTVLDNQFNGGNFRLHAKESRFWIATSTPTDWGELRTYIETDFNSSASTLRLRHAYGSLGPVLAGQTDTTWRHLFAEPELIDFAGPVGVPSVVLQRQALIRFSHNLGGGTQIELGAEDPTGDAIGGGTAAAQRLPDLLLAVSHSFPGGHVRVAGMIRAIEHDNGAGSADEAFGWGVSVGAVYAFTPHFSMGANGFIGEGVGKYQRLLDAVLFSRTKINTVFAYGGTIWAQWRFSDEIRMTGAYSYLAQNAQDEAPGATLGARKAFLAALGSTSAAGNFRWSAHGNILWSPVHPVTFGIEYVYSYESRYGGANAHISRIHGTAIYRF